MKKQVDFYFSPSSRYSYLASTQLDRICGQAGCEFNWLPVNNVELLERLGSNPFHSEKLVSGQYDWAYREYDATCWAEYYGVPFVEPTGFRKDPPYLTRACYAAEMFGKLVPFCRRISHAVFAESGVIDPDLLSDFAVELGISRSEFNSALNLEAISDRLEEILQRALSKNIIGVPTFVYAKKSFWGNDRLPLLEYELTK